MYAGNNLCSQRMKDIIIIVNQANPAYPPKFSPCHFYRKGQKGAVFFCLMNGV